MEAVYFTRYYLPKISAGISIIGSSIVLAEVIKDIRSGRRVSSVARVLVSVSIGDILFSFAWFLGTWVAPKDLDYLDGTNYGTYESCRFQGFLVQFGGLAALLFNASLAVFYLLTTSYNWREQRLHRLEARLQFVVWILCLGIAIPPLPLDMYHNKGPICLVDSYPYGCTETSQLDSNENLMQTDCTAGDNAGFYRKVVTLVSIWGSILCDSVIMCVMYCTVRNLERETASNRKNQTGEEDDSDEFEEIPEDQGEAEEDEEGSPGNSTSSVSPTASQRRTGSKIVAREGILYIAGFLLTFSAPTLNMIVFLVTGNWNGPLDRASCFFITLQGFWNFLIFSRKREMKTKIGRQASRLLRCDPCTGALSAYINAKRTGNCARRSNNPTSPRSHLHEGDISLPPIAEDRQEESPRGPFIQWRNSVAQMVSDLGASGASYIDSSETRESSWDRADGSGKPNQSSQRMLKDGSGRTSDSAPSRPIRIESETSQSPSISTSRKRNVIVDSAPPRPIRVESQAETIITDSSPLRPIRLESEVESNIESSVEHPSPKRLSANTSPPIQPVRFESEGEIDPGNDDEGSIPAISLVRRSSSDSIPLRLESKRTCLPMD